jgi:hypothetical protein
VKFLLRGLILAYRRVSPLWSGTCRFYPSCSEYALGCLEQYAWHRAFIRIVLRVMRCHPFHPGGVDLP